MTKVRLARLIVRVKISARMMSEDEGEGDAGGEDEMCGMAIASV